VLRAGQGAHFYLEIYEDVDLVAWARNYRGRTVATIAAGAAALYAADLSGPIALAIGNEGAGLSASLREAASLEVSIPMPGGFEALNAAAAAAICLFECVRQRRR
jgi:TrmH family RNA methyltransferase